MSILQSNDQYKKYGLKNCYVELERSDHELFKRLLPDEPGERKSMKLDTEPEREISITTEPEPMLPVEECQLKHCVVELQDYTDEFVDKFLLESRSATKSDDSVLNQTGDRIINETPTDNLVDQSELCSSNQSPEETVQENPIDDLVEQLLSESNVEPNISIESDPQTTNMLEELMSQFDQFTETLATPDDTVVNVTVIEQNEVVEPGLSKYAQHSLRPCFVLLERLSEDFIQKALAGQNKSPKSRAAKKKTLAKHPKEEFVQNSEADELDEDYQFLGESEEEVEDGSDSDYEESSESKKRKSAKTPAKEPRSSEFRLHMHVCDKCTFAATSKAKLQKHMAVHQENAPAMVCEYEDCGASFTSKYDFKCHNFECHEGLSQLDLFVVYRCKGCETPQFFKDLRSSQAHVLNHVTPTENSYKCTICLKTFIKYTSFTDHMKTHIHFKCTYCETSYPELDKIERHCQTAHAEYGRPFTCNLCNYRTAVYGLLVEHRAERHGIMYDGEKEKCRFCADPEVEFTEYGEMIMHLADHADVHLYECFSCKFTSNDFNVLGAHVMENHPETVENGIVPINGPNLPRLCDGILFYLKHRANSRILKQQFRSKPTFHETQEAVAALLQETSVSETSDRDSTTPVSVEGMMPSCS
ncbi:Zinc finger and BTB domain-containing protein 16 [Halotydeus destructor]|nr:Zinc finger and BTB domain-containing protein 16 [Halotydeus destructor]